MSKLTGKKELFAQEYVKCGNASEAYRITHPNSKAVNPESIWEMACKLMAQDKVITRVYELQELAQERTLVTVESLTKELEEARVLAIEIKQPSAMNGASMGKAKLHGLDVQKVDMTLSGDLTMINLDKAKKRNATKKKPED